MLPMASGRHGLRGVRRLSSILPKLPHDRQKWPSTLASNKRSINLDELEATLQKQGIKFVMPSFVDMHGVPKAKMVPLNHLYSCSRGSELFTGAAVDGVPQAVSGTPRLAPPCLHYCFLL